MKRLLQKLLCFAISITVLFSLSACQSKNEIKVGTTPGLYTELLRLAQNTLSDQYNIALRIVIKSPPELNKMLASGKIDANFYQTGQALQLYNKTTQPDQPALRNIGNTYIAPMALYSSHTSALTQLKAKDQILVPQSPIEQSIALLLLKNAGVIGLKQTPHGRYSLSQIISLASPRVRISAVDLSRITHKKAFASTGILLYPYQALSLGFNDKQRLFENPSTISHAIVLVAKMNTPKQSALLKLLTILRSSKTQNMISALLHYTLANAF